jgi:uncharacterized protein YciU (UPF0263 family)
MENPLSDILVRAETWPEAARDDLLRAAEIIEREKVGVYKLNAEEHAAVELGLADVEAGRFASEDEIEDLFKKCRS